MNGWEQIKRFLESKLSAEAFQNWFFRTELQAAEGDVLRIAVPDQVTKDFPEQEYGDQIRSAVQVLGPP